MDYCIIYDNLPSKTQLIIFQSTQILAYQRLNLLQNIKSFNKVMQSSIKVYSMKTTLIMIGLRSVLSQKNIDINQFFNKFKLGKPNEISKFQFQKIVQLSKTANVNAMEIIDVYKQLSDGWQFIRPQSFISAFQTISNKIPVQEFKKKNSSEEFKQKQEQLALKKKIIKTGLKKLQKYIQTHNAIQLFQECDEDYSDSLCLTQFNKLLIATQIKEFQDKAIRKILLHQIMSYFPNKEMQRKDFITFFKVKQKKQEDIFYKPQKIKVPQIPIQKIQIPKTKISQFIPDPPKVQQNNMKKKTNHLQVPFSKPFSQNIDIKKEKSIEKKQNQFKKKPNEEPLNPIKLNKNESLTSNQTTTNFINDVHGLFPQSMDYYRLGMPESQQFKYFQQFQNLLASNLTYSDPKNPHSQKGVYKHASEIFEGKYDIFMMAASVLNREKSRIGIARQIQPKDIIQGQIGDCYFLSSIASLISIYPEMISEKFLFKVNKAHYYGVKMFLDGQWKIIITDDKFPCNGNRPIYAKPHGNQIWVMLLQKCWAKIFGSYRAIQSGSSAESFQALTGALTQYVSLGSKDTTQQDLKKKLLQAVQKRQVVTASGSKYLQSLSQTQRQNLGLVSGHAYSFLKIVDANGKKLIKLRNPWGNKEWKGDWSFQSKKWTNQLRQKLNYKKHPQDGAFFMSFQDLFKYYGSFVFCKLNSTYLHSSIKSVSSRNKSNYFKMIVKQAGNYTISIYQQNQRKMLTQFSNYIYSPARIIIMKKLPNSKLEFITSKLANKHYSCSAQCQLEEGEYIVSAKVYWKFWDSHESCLTSYGPQKVVLQKINRDIAPQFKKNLIESFSQKIRGKRKKYDNVNLPQAYSETVMDLDFGIGYYKIFNPTNKWFQVTFRLNSSKGIKTIKPGKLPLVCNMTQNATYYIGFFVSSEGFQYQSSESIKY